MLRYCVKRCTFTTCDNVIVKILLSKMLSLEFPFEILYILSSSFLNLLSNLGMCVTYFVTFASD